MKKEDIKIGQVYAAKVSDKVVTVRIEKENPRGGWEAINLHTNRPVRIKSAQRLRHAIQRDDVADTVKAVASDNLAEGVTIPKPSKKQPAPPKPKAAKPALAKRTGPSLIEAAIQVLGENKQPMTCAQMVETILEQKLWSSTGKTPTATLYSAILRDIQKKGDSARFVHVARGQFQLNTPGRKEA